MEYLLCLSVPQSKLHRMPCTGYECNTMVNNIFAYGPDGKVFFYALNFPGSWADGLVIARFMPYILQHIGEYKIVIDQDFLRSDAAQNVLIGPISPRLA